MATYLQLAQEPEWGAEFEAPAHANLTENLRAFYGHTRSQTGSKGDNNHLRGRHRSRAWILGSSFCTNRSYSVTDTRDKAGDKNWLRGTDIGITGEVLQATTARMLVAVKAGLLPSVAEFFGTVNGSTVVGWFEGQPGTSDESHLYHFHLGLWTQYCDDARQMEVLYRVITGEDDDMAMRFVFAADVPGIPAEIGQQVHITDGLRYRLQPKPGAINNLLTQAGAGVPQTVTKASLPAGYDYPRAVAALCGSPDPGEQAGSGGGSVDTAALRAAVRAELDATKLGAL